MGFIAFMSLIVAILALIIVFKMKFSKNSEFNENTEIKPKSPIKL